MRELVDGHSIEPLLLNELKTALEHGLASGDFMTHSRVQAETATFRDHFGPAVLRDLDGEALLRFMHGRQIEGGSLAYWLEFKNDDQFAGRQFGSISGGSALKFGIYQRQNDNAWMSGHARGQQVLSVEDAVAVARAQRDQLLAGAEVLASLSDADSSDGAYAQLQKEMESAAPILSSTAWAHKYWFLLSPEKIDDFHSPRYQRYHLLTLLQMPPDRAGILDTQAPRFLCAGRFVALARSLEAPITALSRALGRRSPFHRYWRIGTTSGDTGTNNWPEMRDGGFVSIGWSELPDLSGVIGTTDAKRQIRDWLRPRYPDNLSTASRKAGEILTFAREMVEKDLVVACDGQTVLGIGRVRGPYEFDGALAFPHKRAVDWILLDSWRMPDPEGLRTTVYELGANANNLLALETRLFHRDRNALGSTPAAKQESEPSKMPPLDSFATRISSILSRKGQVILYGPPGTGKTYRALAVARELAARNAFGKTLAALTASERHDLEDDSCLVRLCTFHPGWGYEDFIEGLRPKTDNGAMFFEARDGIFKRLCADAQRRPSKHFFLIVDEINRGDLPRIFGELITTLEYDKRDRRVELPLTGSSLAVPRNVFLIGTMNTADRSISLMDAALRRRFGFVELMPDSSLLTGRKAGELPLGAWLDALNARIRKHLKRDARNLQIGHAYLMPSQPITSPVEFARVLRDDIIPLLEEYCYDDFGTLQEILGPDIVDSEEGRIHEDMFAANREADLIDAVWFEEMQPLVLERELEQGTLEGENESIVDQDADGHTSPIQ